MKKPKKPLTDKVGEVREITREDMKDFKPAQEAMPPEFFEGMKRLRGQRGPQKAPTKTPVTLRLDPEIVEHFKKSGRGWQSRINQALRNVVGK